MDDGAVIIVGWPRWVRETVVRAHPVCQDMGIERVVSDASLERVSGVVYRCIEHEPTNGVAFDDEEASQAVGRVQWCLGQVPHEARMIVLRDGYDLDGTVHLSEDVCLSRMTSELLPSSTDRDAVPPSATDADPPATDADDDHATDAEDNPPPTDAEDDGVSKIEYLRPSSFTESMRSVLESVVEDVSTKLQRRALREWIRRHRDEARRRHEKDDEEPKWLRDAHALSHGVLGDHETGIVTRDGTRVVTLVGVLPPTLLRALSRTTLPTTDGDTVAVLRPFASGNVVHVGRVLVDTATWNAEERTYVSPGRIANGLGPMRNLRNIRDIHRRRIAELNRR